MILDPGLHRTQPRLLHGVVRRWLIPMSGVQRKSDDIH